MKYLVTVYSDDSGEPPYEEWADSEPAMYRVVNRIAPMLRAGDTMIVTDDRDNVMQERRKVSGNPGENWSRINAKGEWQTWTCTCGAMLKPEAEGDWRCPECNSAWADTGTGPDMAAAV